MQTIEATLANEQQTEALGRYLAQQLEPPCVIYLQGELGAGKTTLVRGLLRGLGHLGSTKSPTYTLVEPYELAQCQVFHFDLYRLADPEELEYIGIREYQSQDAMLIFEWPDKGQGMIPKADLVIQLAYQELANKEQARSFVLQVADGAKLRKNWNFGDFLCQNGDE